MKKIKLHNILFLLLLACTNLFSVSYRNIPLNSTISTVEPFKGIVFWNTHDQIDTYKNSIALEFSYCLYSDVVNATPGGYDWSKFETLLNDIASRGHQAVVRFRFEYPGPDGAIGGVAGACAVPAYIKALPEYTETFNPNGSDGATYYCDWSSTELQRFTKEFYTKFAERYDNDPRVAFVQTGFGHWSEYHIYGTDLNLGQNFPSHAYQKEFLQHMDTTFKYTPWSVSIDVADGIYTPAAGDPEIMALKFGLFDDSFMHAQHDISQGDGYNETCWNTLNRSRWQFAPGGGEFSYYTANDQKNALNPAGMNGGTWEQRAAQYHMTYIIGNDVTEGYGTVDRVKEASMNSGYKFKITSFQVTTSTAIVKVKNIGIAPLYHDAYVTVNGVKSTISLKCLLPDSTLECSVSGLTIGSTDIPTLTITSDKLLAGVTIPYQANIDENGGSAPTCTLAASKTKVTIGQSTTLTATASSDNGSISKVEIKEGSNVLATLTSAPYTYTFTPATTGDYTITAVATDNNNASSTSEAITVSCSNNSVEDFETLYADYVGTDGSTKLGTGTFRTLDVEFNNNLWSLYLTRINVTSTLSYSGNNSLRLQAVSGNGGYLISPALKGTQTVTLYVRMYKDTKTGILTVYKSTDGYATAIQTVNIPAGATFTEVTIPLAEATSVQLKLVNSTVGTSTDQSILVDDFTYVPYSSATAINEGKEVVSPIIQKGNLLEFNGSNFTVNIYNTQGVKITSTKSNKYNISNLCNGIYIINYIDETGNMTTKKIIK